MREITTAMEEVAHGIAAENRQMDVIHIYITRNGETGECKFDASEKQAELKDVLFAILAGPSVVEAMTGERADLNSGEWDDDRITITSILDRIHGYRVECFEDSATFRYERIKAENFVRKNFEKIEVMARILCARRRLTGDEFRSLLETTSELLSV